MKNAKAVSSKTIFFYCSFQGFQFVDFDLFSVSLCLSCYLCSSPSLGHSFYELIYFGIQKKKSEPNSVETVDCLSICLSNSTLSFVQLHGIRTLFFFDTTLLIHRQVFIFGIFFYFTWLSVEWMWLNHDKILCSWEGAVVDCACCISVFYLRIASRSGLIVRCCDIAIFA